MGSIDKQRVRSEADDAGCVVDGSPIRDVLRRGQSVECTVAHEVLEQADNGTREADSERSEELPVL